MSRTLAMTCALMVAAIGASAALQLRAQPKPPPATIRVVDLPIANSTPLQVARDKGYFADENLSVTWLPVAKAASPSRRFSAAAPKSAPAPFSRRWWRAPMAST